MLRCFMRKKIVVFDITLELLLVYLALAAALLTVTTYYLRPAFIVSVVTLRAKEDRLVGVGFIRVDAR